MTTLDIKKFLQNPVKRILHIGAADGSEIPLYDEFLADEVVWIEANPVLVDKLKERLKSLNPRYKSYVFNKLITNKVGEITDFHLYYSGENMGMSSILKKVSGACGKENAEFNQKNFYQGTIQLESDTIDNLLLSNNINLEFDLINLDTQGAELIVLSEAKKTLEMSRTINTEVTFYSHDYDGGVYFDNLSEYICSFGYKYVGNTEISGDGSWGDSLFSK